MRAFVAIALLPMILAGSVGEAVGGAIETGYEVRESNTRLAVATAVAGTEIVPAAEYGTSGEET